MKKLIKAMMGQSKDRFQKETTTILLRQRF